MFQLRKFKTLGASLLTAWLFLTAPGTDETGKWKQYVNTEKAGWSATGLERARQYAAGIGSSAVMIVDRGNVVAAWGNIEHPYKASSMRKSLYDAAIGAAQKKKRIDLTSTLKMMNIDDLEALTDIEKTATFEHLMTARSGVYHRAAYETPSNSKRRPKRGSAAPGTKWYYNNWDFNLVSTAYKRLSGVSLKKTFADDLARPLGMEDYESDHVFEWLEPRRSKHPAATYRISARDLARVGKMYLQNGKWGKKQIVSSKWIKRSTRPHSTFDEGHYAGKGNGYGRMWWIFPARPERKSAFQAHRRIAARGAGGHIMILFPELDLLIVHRADTDSGRGVDDRDGIKLMDMILEARKGGPTVDEAVGPVRVEKLSEKKPMPLRGDYSRIKQKRRAQLEGRYMFPNRAGLKIYQYQDRLFVQPLGLPLSDAEVFEVSDRTLRSPLVNFVIEPIEGNGKTVDSLRMTFRGRTMVGKRGP